MKILGITLNSELKVDEHIESLISKFQPLTSLYALRILKANGLRKEEIQKVTQAIIMSRIFFLFFFSLFHQRADDEALTRFLQTSLFLVASPILVKSMFFFQVFPDIVHPGLP